VLTSGLYVLLGGVGRKVKNLMRSRIPMRRKWIWIVRGGLGGCQPGEQIFSSHPPF
jgi:hypothetical protein